MTALDQATVRLHRWLEGMHGDAGYGGPVVHWWRDSVLYCGPGLDWRYEGIIAGYLSLFERTGERRFLAHAQRAGDELIRGQLADRTFRNSSFEWNPRPGGTPHEAAADVGLLLLAATLRARADRGWTTYREAAELNLTQSLLPRLWREEARRLGDGGEWFVPNKAATVVEALCLLAHLTGRDEYLERYALPTADWIVKHQVVAAGDRLDGGIAQASNGTRHVAAYFPYYTARSIPGLCAVYRVSGDSRYLDAAQRAGRFLLRWRESDGGTPQVIYSSRRVNRYPRWIAGAGDMVRALDELNVDGFGADASPTLRWILGGQLPTGAIRVAEGFASQVSQRTPDRCDVRDVMPVVGWNDKAFRVLASRLHTWEEPGALAPAHETCTWYGRVALYCDDGARVRVTATARQLYSWSRGTRWAVPG